MRYSVHITNICNLRCTYCYEDDKNDKKRNNFIITKQELNKRFSNILNSQNKCSEIELLGGEVFLFPDILEYIFKEYGKKFIFIITTNGTIRNKRIDNLIQNYLPRIAVSLDDPLTIEKQRIGIDFETTLKNAKYWKNITETSIASVLTPINLNRIKETFDFYVIKNKFNIIHFGCVEEWMNDYYWKIYINEVKRFIDTTSVKTLKKAQVSPWKYYNPFKKEIIYENGIEKLEIFNNKQVELTKYQKCKHLGHEYYCKKIGITPTPLIPDHING